MDRINTNMRNNNTKVANNFPTIFNIFLAMTY
jgi:hypothetical protein